MPKERRVFKARGDFTSITLLKILSIFRLFKTFFKTNQGAFLQENPRLDS